MRARVGRFLLWSPLILLAFAAFIAVGGFVVMQLWNWLTPTLFGWHRIAFWQALGLLALCRILFGGLGRHGDPSGRFRRRMAERWESMSPEERERLRHGIRGHWGGGPEGGEPTTTT